jgi:DNA replication protein DnaC
MPFEEENKCPLCGGTGFIITDKGAKKCECVYKTFNVGKYLNIPKRFWNADIKQLRFTLDRETLTKLYTYLKKFPQMYKEGIGLLLVGEPGVGKTYIVSAALKYLYLKYKVKGFFVDTKELSIKLRESFNSGEHTDLVEFLSRVPVLVLDDLGNETLTDWYREILTGLVSKRYNDKRATFITTNYYPSYLLNTSLDLSGNAEGVKVVNKRKKVIDTPLSRENLLDNRFGSHMVSRLGEMCLTLLINGKDRRMEKVFV